MKAGYFMVSSLRKKCGTVYLVLPNIRTPECKLKAVSQSGIQGCWGGGLTNMCVTDNMETERSLHYNKI